MDGVQHISITGDFLFGSICRSSAIRDEIANALTRCNNPLDPVRGLGALYQRALAQCLEHLRRLLLEQRLFAAVFAGEPYASQQAVVEGLSGQHIVFDSRQSL
jgi:hypothetical protein